MLSFSLLLALAGLTATGLAASYALVTLAAALRWRSRKPVPAANGQPPVTVLKPLCGAEPGLYEHLRSFCMQDYPAYQIVFGVRDPADAALLVARRLQAEFPALPIDIVINPQLHGGNRKVSNLINMLAQARHDVLVMADSDTRVRPDYLAAVTAPLQSGKVGLVTCLYRGVSAPGLWSRLGALYTNDWYIPSVLLGLLIGYPGYAAGQTLCLRRETLQAIGGLQAIADHLADDFRLGELVRGLGLSIQVSPHMIEAQHDEASLRLLTRHELRWMRTTRILRPVSVAFMCISLSLPMAALGTLFAAANPALWPIAAGLLWVTAAARLGLHLAQRDPEQPLLSELWLLPLRDLLTAWVWCGSFLSYRVSWRGNEFDVGADGVMRRAS
jgi:ceramide glucosyltransferase